MALIALRFVRLIEAHSDRLAQGLIRKFQTSSQTKDMSRVPADELRIRTREILQQLSEWLLTKSDDEIRKRYTQLGERRAAQGVSLSSYSWAIVLTKEHIWDFLQRQAFTHSPVEIYGELELVRLLDQFFDHALCYAAQGYERHFGCQSPAASTGNELSQGADSAAAL
jgi:hypothetical protein